MTKTEEKAKRRAKFLARAVALEERREIVRLCKKIAAGMLADWRKEEKELGQAIRILRAAGRQK